MALIGLGGRKAARRPGGHTIVICAAGLLAVLAGLSACGGSSPSSAQNGPPSSSPSSSPSCTTSAFMPGSGHSRAAQPAALAAALVPMPVIVPEPDINLDVPRPADQADPTQQEQAQEQWANNGLDKANSNPESLLGNSAPIDADSLQQESDAVSEREDVTLWTDDLSSPDTFGTDVCQDIQGLRTGVEDLDNVNQDCSYLQQQSDDTAASNAVCGVIGDASDQFDQAFGSCNGIEVTKWLLDALSKLFCLNVGSG
jgi:hypothetical protein